MSVIDQQHALSLLGGHEVIYKKILQKFIDTCDSGSYSFSADEVTGDFETVARKIHSVKGVSQNVGAMALYEIALELDTLAKDKNTSDIIAKISSYDATLSEALNEIKTLV